MVFDKGQSEDIEKKYDIQGGNWMKLKDGENKLRFVSEAVDFGVHNDSVAKRSFICLGKDFCPYCKKGEKSKVRFYVWIIDRAEEELKIKLFDFGYSIYDQINDYRKDDEYAFDKIPPYDFKIDRKGEGLSTRYKVKTARGDSKITEEEEALIKEQCTSLEEVIQKRKDKRMKILGEVKPVTENQKVEETDDKINLAPND